jgi:FkbM family methyltransferase
VVCVKLGIEVTMKFIDQKISGIKKRLKWYTYGIFYRSGADFFIPSSFYINGRKRNFKFIDVKQGEFIYEFNEICLDDCYQLKLLKKRLGNITVIVDIGANQGLFAIAARKHFSTAAIYCYEPNMQLEPILGNNVNELDASIYTEAVTKDDCKVILNYGETDLHTTSHHSEKGDIIGVSFKKVLERAGGAIDILKMDCEGGEWEIFEDRDSFQNVSSITMEYHLWAKEGSSSASLLEILDSLHFKVIFHSPLSETFGLIIAIKNHFCKKI